MKILFVIRSTEHFHYHKSIIKAFCLKRHKIDILFDKKFSKEASLNRIEAYKKETASDFIYDWAVSGNNPQKNILTYSRDLLSYTRYLKDKDLARLEVFKEDWRIHLPIFVRLFLKLPFAKFLITSAPVIYSLSLMEKIFPADKFVVADILERSPDMVIVSPVNMRGSSADLEYLKAASKLKIPTALQVFSWDNLTVRGLIHIIPDLVFVWNNFQAQEALKYHSVPEDRIRITGSPVFDGWFSKLKPSCTRGEFCRQNRLDAKRAIITYLGSSRNIARDERWLVKALLGVLSESGDSQMSAVQIIFRPHPGNFKSYENMDIQNVFVLPKKGAMPDELSALQFFYDTLYYSAVVAGVNTSGTIDAMVSGKPCVGLLVPEYQKTHINTLHLQHLLQSNALYLIKDIGEFPKIFRSILDGHDPLCSNREFFVKNFLRPKGIRLSAGDNVMLEIEKYLNKK